MRTSPALIHSVGSAILIVLISSTSCQRAPDPVLQSGSRLVLVIDSQPPLLPEAARALAPVTDTASITIQVTRLTADSIIGSHSGDLAHFPIQVSDDPTALAPFVGARHGQVWHVDLHPRVIDAGIELRLDLRTSATRGTWTDRSAGKTWGHFTIDPPGA